MEHTKTQAATGSKGHRNFEAGSDEESGGDIVKGAETDEAVELLAEAGGESVDEGKPKMAAEARLSLGAVGSAQPGKGKQQPDHKPGDDAAKMAAAASSDAPGTPADAGSSADFPKFRVQETNFSKGQLKLTLKTMKHAKAAGGVGTKGYPGIHKANLKAKKDKTFKRIVQSKGHPVLEVGHMIHCIPKIQFVAWEETDNVMYPVSIYPMIQEEDAVIVFAVTQNI
ncbi:uncharacterized protein [Diadema setosum]|uniref:uncharacterized protein n=1 Tax=Diadema setosum TaxID=31175 RepID=UPI003B3B938F